MGATASASAVPENDTTAATTILKDTDPKEIYRQEIIDWHNDQELNKATKAFHDAYARQPSRGIEEARRIHHSYLGEIERFLRSKNSCSRVEYSGSTYEGTKVSKSSTDDDLEFDVMIVMDGNKLEADPTQQPGYAVLSPRVGQDGSLTGLLGDAKLFNTIYSRKGVDTVRVSNKFFGLIQTCVNESTVMRDKVRLVKHGPATQMDVYPQASPQGLGSRLYSVDIVPTFDVGRNLYIPKQKKNEPMSTSLWRRSFSVEERNKLTTADQGNGCRKQVLRILKVIRHREATLNKLTTYHLKTALFREMDRDLAWTHADVGKRLMGVLGQLEKALTEEAMPHYFVPQVDLLEGISPITQKNMRDRIRRLRTNRQQMMQLLESRNDASHRL